MKDTRNPFNPNAIIQKTVKVASFELNDESVTEMLQRMGVNPAPETVQEAMGFMSSNGMELNMNNLYDFLKSKSIMSRKDTRTSTKQAVKDLRK